MKSIAEYCETPEKARRSLEILKQEFSAGSGKAGYTLHILYSEGVNLPEEIKAVIGVSDLVAIEYYVKAFDLLMKEAEVGDGESMHLGAMYYQGGPPPGRNDKDLFKFWTDKAVEAGYLVLDDLLAIYWDPKSKFFDPKKAKQFHGLI